jgi:hypothetical protein
MVKVHIWLPNASHIGHAALTINNTYVSFWPDGEAGKKDLKIKTSQPGTFMLDLTDDIHNEGDREPTTIELNDLNEEKILEHIRSIQVSIPRYQLARHNCSNVVVDCLKVGSSVKPSFIPNAGAYSRLGKFLGIGIWTPDQALKFAKELAES